MISNPENIKKHGWAHVITIIQKNCENYFIFGFIVFPKKKNLGNVLPNGKSRNFGTPILFRDSITKKKFGTFSEFWDPGIGSELHHSSDVSKIFELSVPKLWDSHIVSGFHN